MVFYKKCFSIVVFACATSDLMAVKQATTKLEGNFEDKSERELDALNKRITLLQRQVNECKRRAEELKNEAEQQKIEISSNLGGVVKDVTKKAFESVEKKLSRATVHVDLDKISFDDMDDLAALASNFLQKVECTFEEMNSMLHNHSKLFYVSEKISGLTDIGTRVNRYTIEIIELQRTKIEEMIAKINRRVDQEQGPGIEAGLIQIKSWLKDAIKTYADFTKQFGVAITSYVQNNLIFYPSKDVKNLALRKINTREIDKNLKLYDGLRIETNWNENRYHVTQFITGIEFACAGYIKKVSAILDKYANGALKDMTKYLSALELINNAFNKDTFNLDDIDKIFTVESSGRIWTSRVSKFSDEYKSLNKQLQKNLVKFVYLNRRLCAVAIIMEILQSTSAKSFDEIVKIVSQACVVEPNYDKKSKKFTCLKVKIGADSVRDIVEISGKIPELVAINLKLGEILNERIK